MIFEDIVKSGYASCEKYDSYIDYTYGSLRSRDEQVERIGKKYQKIYLYREMGNIYDNYKYSPGSGQLYECCIGEYPWSPTMVNYLDKEEGQDFRQESPAPCYLITTVNDYTTEKDSPFCTNEDNSYMFPSKFLLEKMNLSWNGSFGYDVNDHTVIVNGQNNTIYINKHFLIDFLKQNELDVVWTVLGEKQKITGGFGRDFPGRGEFSYTYYLDDKYEFSCNHKVYNTIEPERY